MKNKVIVILGVLPLAPAVAQHNTLTPAEVAAGYELLFDGKTLSNGGNGINWVTYAQGNESSTSLETGWKVFPSDSAFGKDGIPGNPRDIRSKKKYKDFILEFDFLTNGNSGVYYRETVYGQFGWETGVEFAIDDNTSLLPWIKTGAAYELISANPDTAFKRGVWNKAKIIAIQDSVEHWLNGKKVVAYKYWDEQWTRALNGQVPGVNGARSKWNTFKHFSRPTADAKTGYIQEGYLGLQGDHQGITKFRNVKIAPKTDWTTTAVNPGNGKQAASNALLQSRITYRDLGGESALGLDFKSPFTVEIFDVFGRSRLPKTNAVGMKKIILNRKSFDTGLYFVKVGVAGTILTKKITIQ